MQNEKQLCTDQETHKALLWGAFGQGANMPFDPACVQVATDRKYYDIVDGNCALFKADPHALEAAITCSTRAGRIAAGIATNVGLDIIDASSFDEACADLENRLDQIRTRVKSSGGVVLAGVCGSGG